MTDPTPQPALTITLTDEAVELIAQRVAQLLQQTQRDPDDQWPEWMSIPTAARYLDVSPERVRKLTARNKLPHHQEAPGCRVFLRRQDLDHTLAQWKEDRP